MIEKVDSDITKIWEIPVKLHKYKWDYYFKQYAVVLNYIISLSLKKERLLVNKQMAVMYIYRHSVELFLKMIIEREGKEIPNSHNLNLLVKLLNRRLSQEFLNSIDILEYDTNGDSFRYVKCRDEKNHYNDAQLDVLPSLLLFMSSPEIRREGVLLDSLDIRDRALRREWVMFTNGLETELTITGQYDNLASTFLDAIKNGELQASEIYLPLLGLIRHCLELEYNDNLEDILSVLSRNKILGLSKLSYEQIKETTQCHSLISKFSILEHLVVEANNSVDIKGDKLNDDIDSYISLLNSLRDNIHIIESNSLAFRCPVDLLGSTIKELLPKDILLLSVDTFAKSNAFGFLSNTLLQKYKNAYHISIPYGVTTISSNTFEGYVSLESVDIPNSVTAIHSSAFRDCTSLKNIKIPESITEIPSWAFAGCISLQSIEIPNSVIKIADSAFRDCTSLQCIKILQGVKSIGEWAFKGCSSLLNVDIPESIIWIGKSAFQGCTSIQEINILGDVDDICIMDSVFQDCTSLQKIEINKEVHRISESLFKGCTSLLRVNIYGSERIDKSAFEGCKSLQNIDLSPQLKIIGVSAFCGCTTLVSIDLPNGVTTIEDSAFSGCTSLEFITIPDSVTRIGKCAFACCWSIKTIDVPAGIIKIEEESFYGCDSLQIIDIPYSVKSIEIAAFRECRSLKSIDIPNSVSSIGGSAFEDCNSLQSIDIPNSVTNIGGSAFCGCTSLQKIVFPSSCNCIEVNVFRDCRSLVNVDIPNSVQTIKDSAFSGCTSLQKIVFPSSSNCIEVNAFRDCRSLVNVDIPNSVQTIKDSAFSGCAALQKIFFPNNLTEIGQFAFHGTGLQKVTISSSVNYIGEHAFCNTPIDEFSVSEGNKKYLSVEGVLLCINTEKEDVESTFILLKYPPKKDLTSYIIDNDITSIDCCAFKGASNLVEIIMHDNIYSFGAEQTFTLCKSLKEICIPPKIKQLPPSCFWGCEALENVYVCDRELLQIEKKAFKMCTSLIGLHFQINIPENITVEVDAFDEETYEQCVLYIPSGTRWAYRHHPVFGKFKNIEIEKTN